MPAALPTINKMKSMYSCLTFPWKSRRVITGSGTYMEFNKLIYETCKLLDEEKWIYSELCIRISDVLLFIFLYRRNVRKFKGY